MQKIMKFTFITVETVQADLATASFSEKQKMPAASFFLRMANLQSEQIVLIFMRSFYLLMDLILKFIQLEKIMHMQKLESVHHLMEKFNETR